MNKKKVMKILVVIAVLLIPIMYSFFYLKSYWDPYGHLEGLKIAMVNLDEGEDGENQGKKFVDALIEKDVVTICEVSSEEAERGLREGDYFATITIPAKFTHYLNSASTNDKQIATITYSPNQKTNYLASQIIGKVVTAAELSLEENVSEKVVDTLAEKLESVPESLGDILDGADQIHDGATDLSDGLGKINDGVGTLKNSYAELDTGINSAYSGSQTLNNGIGQVNSGVSTLSSGADSLDSAITQINDGANTLSTQADAGINKLTSGIDKLNGGAAQVAAGTTALVAGTSADSQLGAGAAKVAGGTSALVEGTSASSQLGAGAAAVSGGLTQYTATVNGLLNQLVAAGVVDEATKTAIEQNGAALVAGADGVNLGIAALNTQAQTLNAGASAVSAGIATLNTQAQTLNAGASQVSAGTAELAGTETKQSLTKLISGVSTLQDALGKVKTGTTTLKSGVSTLSNGTNQLQAGSSSLTAGLGKLSEGSGKVSNALDTLKSGTQDAYDGSIELVDGVQTFKDEVGNGLNEANEELTKLDGLSEFVKNPIEFEEVDYGEVSSYGIAFTPLFICVGLWVGILMAYVNLYYDQQKRFKIFGNHSEYRIIRSIAYLGIALVQGFITAYLLKVGLNMQIENNLLYYGSVALVACTFLCIVQFLIVNFGEAGKMIGLLLLVLQLASSGGTFPVQIIDEGFQKISPYMPMTYCINLLKESLIMENTGFVAKNVKVILAYAVVSFAITVVVDLIRTRKRKKLENTVTEDKPAETTE